MTTFNEVKERHLERLEQYVPIVARVHGGSHPEFLQVHEVYKVMLSKLKSASSPRPELDGEFEQLRKITNNYAVPSDTCESYEAVYEMLSELDRAYQG